MSREYMCQWGNCSSTDTPISVNYHKEERPHFCSVGHAALWLLNRDYSDRRTVTQKLEQMSKMSTKDLFAS